MLTERFSKAVALAIQAHEGQIRKGTAIPYISHPIGVASIALEHGADEDQAIAALLHDVLEDGGRHFEPIIGQMFGERVLEMVQGCTDGVPNAQGVKADWWTRKRAYIQHLESASDEVLLVSGSDKLHNARAIVNDLQTIGLEVFSRFSAGREATLWYYKSLAELFTKRQAPMHGVLHETVGRMEALAR